MLKKIKNISLHNVCVIAFLVLYMFMILFIPRNLDDWTWGSDIGIKRLLEGFAGYNGRYLGDITVILFTRLPIFLLSVIEAAIVGIILWEVEKIVQKKSLIMIFIITLIVMPQVMFTQTFGWVSGFSNYIVSLLFIVSYIFILKNFYQYEKLSKPMIVLFLIFGVAAQLFLETTTIFFCMASIFTVTFYFIYYKKINYYYMSIMVGNLVGALIMFMNTAYTDAATGEGETYKDIEVSVGSIQWLTERLNKFTKEIVQSWFTNNHILLLLLGVTAIAFCVVIDFKWKKIFVWDYVICIGYFVYKVCSPDTSYYLKYEYIISTIIYLIFYFSLIVCVVWGIKELKEKFIILVTLLSQIPLVFSLVIAEPLNSRCYMQSYIMFALFIVEIISYCMNRMKLQLITENKKRKIYKYSGYAILIFIVLSMTKNISACIFLNNAEMEKHQYIEKMLENKKETITVPYLPFSNLYTVNINPIDENWQINFNNYYNYPQATRYEYISYNEWKDTVYKK